MYYYSDLTVSLICHIIFPNTSILNLGLLTENGSTKDDLRLPTEEALLAQVRDSVCMVICLNSIAN